MWKRRDSKARASTLRYCQTAFELPLLEMYEAPNFKSHSLKFVDIENFHANAMATITRSAYFTRSTMSGGME